MIEEMETTVMKEMGQTVRMEAVETTEKTETKGGEGTEETSEGEDSGVN
jgi:hypothetical protein